MVMPVDFFLRLGTPIGMPKRALISRSSKIITAGHHAEFCVACISKQRSLKESLSELPRAKSLMRSSIAAPIHQVVASGMASH
jgi:hypothetical protein